MTAAAPRMSVGEEFAITRQLRKTATWWRVETDDDGHVFSCEEVAAPDDPSRHVYFVRAETEEQAKEAARNRRRREKEREKRRLNKANGLCACGKQPRLGRATCDDCAERNREQYAALEVRASKRHAAREEEIAAHLAQQPSPKAASNRLAVLREVRRAWESAETIRVFSGWLADELRKLGVTS